MNIKDIEKYISNIWLLGFTTLIEIGISFWTWSFKNSQLVKNITSDESLNTISKSFKIIQLNGYYFHLIFGIIWIFFLLGLILYSLKQRKYVGVLWYILFIVIFWLIFWDPILTSFLIVGSLGIAAMYSFDN
ncbi:hypothetical protein ACFSN5_07730 [Streptococcus tangpeifui]|uniref:hypothetical protein n=1 Tax=Streptococcus tangpeifui TaxID=2709400 RepID=UPI0013E9BAD8|nr:MULTISPECIES: hypothetical protein [unclassified Streptococcus]